VARDDDRPAIGLVHHVMASADSHDHEIKLIRRADFGQYFQRVSQVGNRGFRRRTVANRPDPRAQPRRGTPDACADCPMAGNRP
jgi:hypothetical protein